MSSGSSNASKDNTEKIAFDTPPQRLENVSLENGHPLPPVDAETERRLLRKLDARIIPMLCWVYLMNFMDRGKSGTFLMHVD